MNAVQRLAQVQEYVRIHLSENLQSIFYVLHLHLAKVVRPTRNLPPHATRDAARVSRPRMNASQTPQRYCCTFFKTNDAGENIWPKRYTNSVLSWSFVHLPYKPRGGTPRMKKKTAQYPLIFHLARITANHKLPCTYMLRVCAVRYFSILVVVTCLPPLIWSGDIRTPRLPMKRFAEFRCRTPEEVSFRGLLKPEARLVRAALVALAIQCVVFRDAVPVHWGRYFPRVSNHSHVADELHETY